VANGEHCIKCGYQETEHLHPQFARDGEPPCKIFKSEVPHISGCPVIGCTGDCDETIREHAHSALCHAHWTENAWTLNPNGNLYFVDMGI
jgi:hypothetical protein